MKEAKSISMREKMALTANKMGIVLVLLVLVIICSVISPVFLSTANLMNILKQVCVVALLAFAEAILIISGSIDLSAGATMCFAGVIAIPVYVSTGNIWLAILASVGMGILLNAITGVFVAALGLPAFVATLAMNMSARGAVKVYTGGQTITETGKGFSDIGQGYVFGVVPISVVVMLLGTLLLWIVLSKTRFGRNLYAVGGNSEAARASGINVRLYRLYSFLFAGLYIGIAGFMYTSRVNAGIPTAGTGYEGQGISSAIIGGVAFAGGEGGAFGVLTGAVIIGVINNILNLMRVDSYMQEVINGIIIVAAVVLDLQTKKKKLGQ